MADERKDDRGGGSSGSGSGGSDRPAQPQKSGGTGGFYWLLVAVAVVGAGAVGLAVRSKRAAAPTGPVALPADLGTPAQILAAAPGVALGDSAAAVTLLEFADFQCPYCATFATQIEPDLREQRVDPGAVRYVFFDFPLRSHAHSTIAARAARCAQDQGSFWEYHDALFAQQTGWAPTEDPRPEFARIAAELGLDEGAFQACLASDRHADEIASEVALGHRLGVDRTPTILVLRDGRAENVVPTREAVNAALDGAAVGSGE